MMRCNSKLPPQRWPKASSKNVLPTGRRGATLLVWGLLLATSAFAQLNLLSRERTPESLHGILVAPGEWKPFPTGADRAAWETLPDAIKVEAVSMGEQALDYDWPMLKATDILHLKRTGSYDVYQSWRGARRGRLADLVLAECVEGKGRFLDQIVNGLWATCEETWWGNPGAIGALGTSRVPTSAVLPGNGPIPSTTGAARGERDLPNIENPAIDLVSAATAAQLALSIYLLGQELDKVSPLVALRVRSEIQRKMLTPALEQDDIWWMGFPNREVNNWNPWINSNWLTCVLLVETEPKRYGRAVEKILRSVDTFLNHYSADGGCNEGPGYWGHAGASLFDCLELMHSASNGRYDLYESPLIRNIGAYIYRMHIDRDFFFNSADASPRTIPAADLVHRYGQRIGDDHMSSFGAWLARLGESGGKGGVTTFREMQALFNREQLLRTEGRPPYLRDVWLPQLQVFAGRDQSGSPRGLYIGAKGGHNDESHNHNDIGSFIVYSDGLPVLVDPGVENYTLRTFGPDRYEIWTMQSAYHNLPTVNGVMQKDGRQFGAANVTYSASDAYAELSMDIAGAYPKEAGIVSWNRTVRLNRGNNAVIDDVFKLNQPVSNITLTLMTPCAVTLVDPGILRLDGDARSSGSATIVFDPVKLTVTTERIALGERLSRGWSRDHLTRVLLTTNQSATEGDLRVTVTQ